MHLELKGLKLHNIRTFRSLWRWCRHNNSHMTKEHKLTWNCNYGLHDIVTRQVLCHLKLCIYMYMYMYMCHISVCHDVYNDNWPIRVTVYMYMYEVMHTHAASKGGVGSENVNYDLEVYTLQSGHLTNQEPKHSRVT